LNARQIRYAQRAIFGTETVDDTFGGCGGVQPADGTVLNNIFLTGTLQDGLMRAKGAFQMGRGVTLDWHKN
jgi:hypothetical protein